MKNVLSIHSSLLLTLLVGIGLSSAHNIMKSKVAPAVINEYSIQPSTTSVSSLLVPGIQNLVLLTTLSALGISTPALIGIGIMTSKVQANSFEGVQGMSPDNRINGTRRRRAHPRYISVTGPDTDDKNSYHVAEVLVKKFAEITGQVSGRDPEMESPTSDALGRGGEVKGEFLDVESDLNVLKSGLYIKLLGITTLDTDVPYYRSQKSAR